MSQLLVQNQLYLKRQRYLKVKVIVLLGINDIEIILKGPLGLK